MFDSCIQCSIPLDTFNTASIRSGSSECFSDLPRDGAAGVAVIQTKTSKSNYYLSNEQRGTRENINLIFNNKYEWQSWR